MNEKRIVPKPRRDGSGMGIRANRGRGGCETLEDRGVNIDNDRPRYFGKWRRALKRQV